METREEANQIAYNILDTPKELLHAVVERISNEDRSHVRLVSRLFFDLVGRSHFSLGLIMPSEMEQFVRVFGRYKKPIGLTFNKTKKLNTDDMKHLAALTELNSLDIKGDIDRVDSSILISLSSKLLSLKVGGHAIVATSTLQHLSNLTRLDATVTGDGSNTAILTKMESLDVTNREDSWPNITCPKVTSLTLRSSTSPPQEWLAQFKPKTMALQQLSDFSPLHYQLPSGSCQNLTSLSLSHVTLDNKSEVPWHQLKELNLDFIMKTTDVSALQHVSKCTSLTKLDINSPIDQDTLDAIDVREMKHLQSFTMTALFANVKNLIPQLNKDSLTTLSLSLCRDYEECFEEISMMTNLESLYLSLRHSPSNEPVDLSSLMTMTFLTSLTLYTGRCLGLDNLTSMTNLNTLKISGNPKRPLKKLKLESFPKLTDLYLVTCVNVVDLRGATQIQRLVYDAAYKNAGGIELIAEELTNLKKLNLGLSAKPIPWTTIAKFTALESIVTDSLDTDDTITQLQNLKRLTQLSNKTELAYSCVHFNPNYLTHLTQLQFIHIVVPQIGVTASIEPKLPRVTVRETLCKKCGKKDPEDD